MFSVVWPNFTKVLFETIFLMELINKLMQKFEYLPKLMNVTHHGNISKVDMYKY